MSIINEKEGKKTAIITKQFLIEYATYIAKAAKEDWLAFVGLKDSISDKEKQFIKKLESLFDVDKKFVCSFRIFVLVHLKKT